MGEESLDDIIALVRTRLQAELERQLLAVSERHQQALAAARQQIEADMERHAADKAVRVRAEMEQALETERQLSQSRLAAERRALEQLEQARGVFEAEREQWAASRAGGMQAPAWPVHADSLIRGMREIDAATSVSDSLAAIARAAAAEAPRAALFIANGRQLDEWAVTGLSSLSAGSVNIDDPNAGIVVDALTKRHVVRNNGSACAVPLVLDGVPIAVLYGEADTDSGGDSDWAGGLEAVALYGAARLGYLTALRTAQARNWLGPATEAGSIGHSAAETEGKRVEAARRGAGDTVGEGREAVVSARRYARLVVSEVKLYNEAAVQSGRSHGDLLERLGPEIERARRLYEERVPALVPGRADFFQQELVQTLAGGDSSLLG